MLRRTVTVGSASGLHARPAAVFTKAAAETGIEVLISTPGGDPVDARSMLSVMTLGVSRGDEVILASPDESAGEALDELAELLRTDLDA
jgi:phosphocarrier protein